MGGFLSTSKNENADHPVKETYAITSRQVTYETERIFLLHDSKISNALIFFYVFYCNLKEKDHIRRIINSEKRNIYM